MSIHSYIAKFLHENGYHKTLKAFEEEHNEPIILADPVNADLESQIVEKLKYLSMSEDLVHGKELPQGTVEAGPTGLSSASVIQETPWIRMTPSLSSWAPLSYTPNEVCPVDGLVIDCAFNSNGVGLFATATRNIIFVDMNRMEPLLCVKNALGNFVVRKVAFAKDLVILAGINGLVKTARFDCEAKQLTYLGSIKAHERLIVDMKLVTHSDKTLIVTLGWDRNINMFEVQSNGQISPFGETYLISGPGNCLEVTSLDKNLVLFAAVKESSLLDVITITSEKTTRCQIALSDVEYSTVQFTPMYISVNQSDKREPLVAVATSHEPFMRIILLSLKGIDEGNEPIRRSQVLANFNTLSPQDKYSEAKFLWRQDGSGFWIMGDDGTLRGLELETGKIVQELSAHDGRVKAVSSSKEQFLTCGIDRKIFLWK